MSQVMHGEVLPFNRPSKKVWTGSAFSSGTVSRDALISAHAESLRANGTSAAFADKYEQADEHNISTAAKPDKTETQELYNALLQKEVSDAAVATGKTYLRHQLQFAQQLESDLPGCLSELEDWSHQQTDKVSQEYQAYLDSRKAGAPRRYFSSRAHALNFIRRVGPTKLVDGAWLYGLTKYWNDFNYASLIRIYLEELGEGNPAANHVLIYKKLLAQHGCDDFAGLSEDHFTQGAIQLALAYNPDDFLPELIGFNLGYEQLPLHLLITAYELNELGIDPSYFTLHITIDNQATGHAHKAVEAVMQNIPVMGDEQEYFRRIRNGYKLNMLGASTTSIIDSFDLYEELINIFREKSRFGKNMHSDYCRLEGRTVNEWLAHDEQIPGFIKALENKGWIMRHENPAASRFWKLIDGDHAEMFGVFSSYEKQVIYEWIAGDWKPEKTKAPQLNITSLNLNDLSFRAKRRLFDQMMPSATGEPSVDADMEKSPEITAEQKLLEQKINSAADQNEVFSVLARLISPAMHHTPLGLTATRIYASLL